MSKLIKFSALALLMLPLLAGPMLAGAQSGPTQPGDPIQSVDQVENLLRTILGWVNTFFYILATLFIILAAFQYLTAQGSDDKLKKAKNMLIYAIIAIVIALIAGGVEDIIRNLVETA